MSKYVALIFCIIALASGLHVSEVKHEQFSLGAGKVTLLADTGRYLCRCNGCGPSLGGLYDSAAVEQTSVSGPWCIWTVQMYGNKAAFKGDTGKYLARCANCWSGGKYPDSAFIYMTSPTGAALWTPTITADGKYLLLQADNGLYLARCQNCVSGVTRDYGFAYGNSTSSLGMIYAYWRHEFIFPTGKVNLQTDTGEYLARCNGCGPSNLPDSASLHVKDPATSSAIWTVEKYGTKVAFKSDSGKYLARCTNCWFGGFPPDSAFVHVASTSDPAALWTPVYLNNGKWAFKSDLGRHLARCDYCVAGAYPRFGFAHVDSPSEGPWAHWTVISR